MVNNFTDKLVAFLNNIAGAWLMLLAIVIFIDVVGRGVFNTPFLGASEIIANSIVTILFLQLPLAVKVGTMLRTTVTYDRANVKGKRLINAASYFIGVLLFLAMGFGGWEDMILGWEIKEFEGVGALEVPTYPTRTAIVFFSMLIAGIYSLMLVRTLQGKEDHVEPEEAGL